MPLPSKVHFVAPAWLMLSILSCVIGQLFLKLGVKNINSFSGIIPSSSHLIGMVNFSVGIGLFLYIASTLFWIFTLSEMDLSFAYPVASLQYVFVLLGAWYFLGEIVNWLRLGGMALICLGVGITYMGEDTQ
jgi:drug/metabolite transporter (DMT)-like permease